MRRGDTSIGLDFGQKLAEGTPSAVQKNPAVITAYREETIGADQP
jgi:ABC-type branched-subunit amino acid transport system ATPase component